MNEKMKKISGGSLPAKIFGHFNQNIYERYDNYGEKFTPQSAGYGRDINC